MTKLMHKKINQMFSPKGLLVFCVHNGRTIFFSVNSPSTSSAYVIYVIAGKPLKVDLGEGVSAVLSSADHPAHICISRQRRLQSLCSFLTTEPVRPDRGGLSYETALFYPRFFYFIIIGLSSGSNGPRSNK